MLSRYINISVSVIAHTETHRLKDRQTHTHIQSTNANKFVVYSKFMEAVQTFVRQNNILLLSFVYLRLLSSLIGN